MEIKGHIRRMTYNKMKEVDSDTNIMNLKNKLMILKMISFDNTLLTIFQLSRKTFPMIETRYLRGSVNS